MADKSTATTTGEWLVLITVMIGTFLGRIDQTIVNLAIPHIINEFQIGVSAAGWIGTAYILANAVFVPIWGKLGDTVGRKKIYILGFVIFIIGSVLAGLSWGLGSLIFFRIIQAIAGSADYPTAMAILTVTFTEGKKRAQALGIWSASFAAGAVFGPLIGGPLIDYFGWRSIFLINLPIGIIGLLMAMRFIHESVSEKKTVKFDWWGAISLGIVLSSIILLLEKGMTWGWTSYESMISYFVIASFSGLFFVIEKSHSEPIIDLKFFKNSPFVTTLANNFVVFMGMMGAVFLIPVFAQTFLGYTSTQAGLLFIPMALFFLISSPLGGSLIGKVKPKYVLFVSTIIAAIGIFMLRTIDVKSTPMELIFPLCVMAFGIGFGMAQRTNIVAVVVPQNEIGVASSILALVRNIAGAFGIAMFATLLTTWTERNVLNLAQNSVLYAKDSLHYKEFIGLIILKAQILAYSNVFITAAIIIFIGAFTSFLINIKKELGDTKVHVEG